MDSKAELYVRDFTQLNFKKSKRSAADDPPDNCVEVGFFPDGVVAVRDSNNPTAPPQVYTPGEWAAFTAGVRAGEFDD